MTDNLDWLSLDEGEEVLWTGSPKIQRLIGFKITDYVVTNEGLYRKSGILSRSVKKIGFEKVQNISFSQSFIGKIFGHGNIEISTAGSSGTEMRFVAVDNPQEVQELINQRIKEEKSESSKEGKSRKEILKEIRDEVKEINEKLD